MDRSKPTVDVRLLTVKEAAAKLCCSPATVYEHIQCGDLSVVRIGRHKGYRIDVRDLDKFVNDRKFCYESESPQRSRPNLKHLKL